MEGTPISVFIRIRPPPTAQLQYPVKILRGGELKPANTAIKWQWDEQHIVSINPEVEKGCQYTFNTVFGPVMTTPQIYDSVAKPVVKRMFEGINGCIFAYGQTNSGKTYTIHGDNVPGIIPLAVIDLFKHIQQTPNISSIVRVSYLEVYNEQLKDLLSDEPVTLAVQDHPYRGVLVVGLSEMVVDSLDQVLKLLSEGEARRMMGKNNVHLHASRSHTIFQLILESRCDDNNVRISTLNLVDLAGSEATYHSTEPTPEDVMEQRMQLQTISAQAAIMSSVSSRQNRPLKEREGRNIRKSLLSLVRVVNLLSQKSKDIYIPYRDSKLTRILRPALGGNSNTVIICTVNPTEVKETQSTLHFAITAQKITNKPKIVQVMSSESLLHKYQNELKEMKDVMCNRTEQTAEMLEKMSQERKQIEKALQAKIQMEANQKKQLEQQLQVKMKEEDTLRNEYENKLKEQEMLKRKFENLNRFILTSSTKTTNSNFETNSTFTNDIHNYRLSRRHSFDSIRDHDSRSLFYNKVDTISDALSKIQKPDFKDAEVEALQKQVKNLQSYITKIENKHLNEMNTLNGVIDQFESTTQKDQDDREEFYNSIKPAIMDSPLPDKTKTLLISILTNIYTINMEDIPNIKTLLQEHPDPIQNYTPIPQPEPTNEENVEEDDESNDDEIEEEEKDPEPDPPPLCTPRTGAITPPRSVSPTPTATTPAATTPNATSPSVGKPPLMTVQRQPPSPRPRSPSPTPNRGVSHFSQSPMDNTNISHTTPTTNTSPRPNYTFPPSTPPVSSYNSSSLSTPPSQNTSYHSYSTSYSQEHQSPVTNTNTPTQPTPTIPSIRSNSPTPNRSNPSPQIQYNNTNWGSQSTTTTTTPTITNSVPQKPVPPPSTATHTFPCGLTYKSTTPTINSQVAPKPAPTTPITPSEYDGPHRRISQPNIPSYALSSPRVTSNTSGYNGMRSSSFSQPSPYPDPHPINPIQQFHQIPSNAPNYSSTSTPYLNNFVNMMPGYQPQPFNSNPWMR